MNKAAKFIIGLILLPTAFFICLGFADIIWALFKNYKITVYFLLGAALYLLLHFSVYKFDRLYVIAHEFAHAIAALVCGYKVSGLTVKQDSGKIKVTGVNVFVLLAPYIAPLYALLTVITYYAAGLFINMAPYKIVFLALLGFFSALHITHTVKSLTETEQSDIAMAGGGIFSFFIIVLANALIFAGLFELLFPGIVPVGGIMTDVAKRTFYFWETIFKYMYNFIFKSSNV